MWPWGHLAVAYLTFLAWTVHGDRREASRTPRLLFVLAFGSQLPDVIDKPLAWWLGVLPSGRSLGHSLVTAMVVLSVSYALVGTADRRRAVTAFGVGWVSHSFADLGLGVVRGLVRGDASQLKWATYLVWPLLPPPAYGDDQSFPAIFDLGGAPLESLASIEMVLVVVALVIWIWSGAPGAKKLVTPFVNRSR